MMSRSEFTRSTAYLNAISWTVSEWSNNPPEMYIRWIYYWLFVDVNCEGIKMIHWTHICINLVLKLPILIVSGSVWPWRQLNRKKTIVQYSNFKCRLKQSILIFSRKGRNCFSEKDIHISIRKYIQLGIQKICSG